MPTISQDNQKDTNTVSDAEFQYTYDPVSNSTTLKHTKGKSKMKVALVVKGDKRFNSRVDVSSVTFSCKGLYRSLFPVGDIAQTALIVKEVAEVAYIVSNKTDTSITVARKGSGNVIVCIMCNRTGKEVLTYATDPRFDSLMTSIKDSTPR